MILHYDKILARRNISNDDYNYELQRKEDISLSSLFWAGFCKKRILYSYCYLFSLTTKQAGIAQLVEY